MIEVIDGNMKKYAKIKKKGKNIRIRKKNK